MTHRVEFRFLCFLSLIAAIWAADTHAQLGVRLEFDRECYLKYEPVYGMITVRNYTGNTLIFGESDAKETRGMLRFIVKTNKGLDASSVAGDFNPVDGLILGAGETRKIRLMLNNYLRLQRDDVYTVSVQIGHPRLSHDIRSDPASFEIASGLPVWEKTVGVPASNSLKQVESRHITVLLLKQKEGELYCLKIEDDKSVYAVSRLGPRLSGADPVCDVDALSNIHLLFQVRPRLYSYRVYDCNGTLKQDKYFVMHDSIPRLHHERELGRVSVKGGREAVKGVDYAENLWQE